MIDMPPAGVDITKDRLHFADHVEHYDPMKNLNLAYQVWLALPKGVRCAFRGANDKRPVYSWDMVDKG